MPSTGQVLCTDCGPEACRRKTAGNNFAALLGDDASSSSDPDEVDASKRVFAEDPELGRFLASPEAWAV